MVGSVVDLAVERVVGSVVGSVVDLALGRLCRDLVESARALDLNEACGGPTASEALHLHGHIFLVGVHLNLQHRRRDGGRVRDTCATTRAANAGAWRCLYPVTCLAVSLLSQLQ